MMTEQKRIYTGMVVFERPIQIEDNTIYGIIYNKETEQRNRKNGNDLADYVSYMVGVECFLKNGGSISDDGYTWTYPDGMHEVLYNHSLQRLLLLLMRDIVKIEIVEFDKPIEWNDGEIDNDIQPCFIIDTALIERYKTKEVDK